MEVHTQVPVGGEEALVQVVQLVVVFHEQLQTGLVTTGRTHRLLQETNVFLHFHRLSKTEDVFFSAVLTCLSSISSLISLS